MLACAPKPKPIEYGADGCEYCKMTIVDNQYAAEAVTDKGRVYKFDAIECMVNYTLNNPETEMAFLLVNHFTQPGELISVDKSTFLISKNMPSPMGAFLSAYPSPALAAKMQKEKEGTLYNWAALQTYFQEKGENYFITNHEK
jgi:copper chaperone NosL